MSYTLWRIPGKTPSGPIDFYAMSEEEADAYLREFVKRIPDRIRELQEFVSSTKGFENWRSDGSAESFEILGRWVQIIAGRQQLSAAEGADIRRLQGESVFSKDPLPETRWTDLSLSVFGDIGIYWCESLRRSNPHLKWDRCRRKNETGQNQPAIVFGRSSTKSPFGVGDVFGGDIAKGGREPGALRKFYEYWKKSAVIIAEREAREQAPKGGR